MPGRCMLSEFRKTHIIIGKRLLVPANMVLRPEGPAMNRPGRKAGIGIAERWSAEGAAPEISIVPRLWRSIFHSESDPGLTAGPTNFRPFGPKNCCLKTPPNLVACPSWSSACRITNDALYSSRKTSLPAQDSTGGVRDKTLQLPIALDEQFSGHFTGISKMVAVAGATSSAFRILFTAISVNLTTGSFPGSL